MIPQKLLKNDSVNFLFGEKVIGETPTREVAAVRVTTNGLHSEFKFYF